MLHCVSGSNCLFCLSHIRHSSTLGAVNSRHKNDKRHTASDGLIVAQLSSVETLNSSDGENLNAHTNNNNTTITDTTLSTHVINSHEMHSRAISKTSSPSKDMDAPVEDSELVGEGDENDHRYVNFRF